jgi:four helix bundle protein
MCWEDSYFDLLPQSPRIIVKPAAAKSDLDFISKLEGAQQELGESDLWLELLAESGVIKPTLVQPLRQEPMN